MFVTLKRAVHSEPCSEDHSVCGDSVYS